MIEFYVGTHMPHWLTLVDFPLFVSRTRLERRRTLPRARGSWALDSGGFSELQHHGRWTISPSQYVSFVRRCVDEIGSLAWAAPMDWMSEGIVRRGGRIGPQRFAGTGLSVAEHRHRTVENYLELRELAPDLPFRPVLQGDELDDYLRCAEAYAAAGVDLTTEPVAGLGSVCRRQGTGEIGLIVSTLAGLGLQLHGFGVKTEGLAEYADGLASADSMAWSFRGRHVPGCAPGHKTEANCLLFARAWRHRLLTMVATRPHQPALNLFAGAVV